MFINKIQVNWKKKNVVWNKGITGPDELIINTGSIVAQEGASVVVVRNKGKFQFSEINDFQTINKGSTGSVLIIINDVKTKTINKWTNEVKTN